MGKEYELHKAELVSPFDRAGFWVYVYTKSGMSSSFLNTLLSVTCVEATFIESLQGPKSLCVHQGKLKTNFISTKYYVLMVLQDEKSYLKSLSDFSASLIAEKRKKS